MNNTKQQLFERIDQFTGELGIPVTAFTRNVNISVSSYYKWRSGVLKISDIALQRIDEYLAKYGF